MTVYSFSGTTIHQNRYLPRKNTAGRASTFKGSHAGYSNQRENMARSSTGNTPHANVNPHHSNMRSANQRPFLPREDVQNRDFVNVLDQQTRDSLKRNWNKGESWQRSCFLNFIREYSDYTKTDANKVDVDAPLLLKSVVQCAKTDKEEKIIETFALSEQSRAVGLGNRGEMRSYPNSYEIRHKNGKGLPDADRLGMQRLALKNIEIDNFRNKIKK